MQNKKEMLLHCCCAPCSCSIIERLVQSGVNPILFFYNPNIHPEEEYLLRKSEIIRYAKKYNIDVVDADYNPKEWFEAVKGHERDREQGERCSICFHFRLLKTAEYAAMNGLSIISSTIGISRRKNFAQVTSAGKAAAACVPGITYWECNWRKNDGTRRMAEIVKEEKFYRQTYCGCLFSHRG